jgi:hypothetical protein
MQQVDRPHWETGNWNALAAGECCNGDVPQCAIPADHNDQIRILGNLCISARPAMRERHLGPLARKGMAQRLYLRCAITARIGVGD